MAKKVERPRIARFGVEGFKRLRKFDLEIRPLMVLIGPNGAGKTSLLEAIRLLSSSASANLNETINKMGGFGTLLTRDATQQMHFNVSKPVQGFKPLEYDLYLEQHGNGFAIGSENLSQVRNDPKNPFRHIITNFQKIQYFDTTTRKLERPHWEMESLETALSQVPKMFQEAEDFRRILSSTKFYHTIDVGERAPIKLPQEMRPATSPGRNGEDLIPFLYYLRETDKDRFELVEDTLKAAFSTFDSLNFPPVASGMLTLAWKDSRYNKPFFAHELSEGTLRFLWLISLLYSPDLPVITIIDEPEVSMHPEMLSLLAELFQEASVRTQLILATHSDRLIRFLKPEEILAMDLDVNGFTIGRWGDEFGLNEWMKDYTLDELWHMGMLKEFE